MNANTCFLPYSIVMKIVLARAEMLSGFFSAFQEEGHKWHLTKAKQHQPWLWDLQRHCCLHSGLKLICCRRLPARGDSFIVALVSMATSPALFYKDFLYNQGRTDFSQDGWKTVITQDHKRATFHLNFWHKRSYLVAPFALRSICHIWNCYTLFLFLFFVFVFFFFTIVNILLTIFVFEKKNTFAKCWASILWQEKKWWSLLDCVVYISCLVSYVWK